MESEFDERSSDQEPPQPARRFLQRLAVEAEEKIVLVRVEDIRWMQSSGNHIRLHLGKTSYLIRQSMKHLQTLLDPNRFLRVHRNAIVNLDHVEEFHLPPNGNMFVKLNDGLCLLYEKPIERYCGNCEGYFVVSESPYNSGASEGLVWLILLKVVLPLCHLTI